MEMHTRDRRVIDLHCDTLTECGARGIGLNSEKMPHFSLDRVPKDLRWCQCMAVFIPDSYRGEEALRYFEEICAIYERECALYADRMAPVTELSGIERALDERRCASILTVEGGAVLAGKLENVERIIRRGVRMMTLTWNAQNEIAGGADTDEGFSAFGRQVVGEMERLGMAVDVSHLSDRGFWELCTFAQKPFAASHSNARAVCGHRRNLSDEMFREMVRRGGIVGLNYARIFITDDGKSQRMDDLLRHLYHFLELGGERCIALGSDYDGTDIPPYLDGVDRFENLLRALDDAGIPAGVVDDLLFGNALRYLSAL